MCVLTFSTNGFKQWFGATNLFLPKSNANLLRIGILHQNSPPMPQANFLLIYLLPISSVNKKLPVPTSTTIQIFNHQTGVRILWHLTTSFWLGISPGGWAVWPSILMFSCIHETFVASDWVKKELKCTSRTSFPWLAGSQAQDPPACLLLCLFSAPSFKRGLLHLQFLPWPVGSKFSYF